MAIVVTQYDDNNKRAIVGGQNESDGSPKGVVSPSDTRLSVYNGGFVGEGLINGSGYTSPDISAVIDSSGFNIIINNKIRCVKADGNGSWYSYEIAPQTIRTVTSYDAVYTLYAFQNDVLIDGDFDSKVGLALMTSDDLDNGVAICKFNVSSGVISKTTYASYTRAIGSDFELNTDDVLVGTSRYIDGTGLSGTRFVGEQMYINTDLNSGVNNGKYVWTGAEWQKFQLGTDIVDTFGFYRKRWQPNTEYSVGDIVIVSNSSSYRSTGWITNGIMVCQVAHTSETTFPNGTSDESTNYWRLLNAGSSYERQITNRPIGWGLTAVYTKRGHVVECRINSSTTSSVSYGVSGTLAETIPVNFEPSIAEICYGRLNDVEMRYTFGGDGKISYYFGRISLHNGTAYSSGGTGSGKPMYATITWLSIKPITWEAFTPV